MLHVINKLKAENEEKVGISIKVPLILKNEYDLICKKENVSLNALLNALMIESLESYKKQKKEEKN